MSDTGRVGGVSPCRATLFELSAGNASQEDGQLRKVVDIGGAVNTMVMHLARANLAGTIQQVAASAMGLQQKLEVDRARQKQQQQ